MNGRWQLVFLTARKLKLELVEDYALNDQTQLIQLTYALERLGGRFCQKGEHLNHNLLTC